MFHWTLFAIFAPFLWSGAITILIFLRSQLSSDRYLASSLRALSVVSLICSAGLFFVTLRSHVTEWMFDFGEWFPLGDSDVPLALYVDSVGAGYLLLSDIILTLVVHFSTNYLIGDRGFKRFFVCIGLMRAGLGLVCLAGTLDALLIGWELVGICSVLLIGFFRYNHRAAENSWMVFCAYRLADIGLIVAIGLIHELGHGVHFANLSSFVFAPHPDHPALSWLIPSLLVFGSLAKSGQFPFHWWVPRAMEGPSPSSAVFYGALSIHLGVFLLLRTYGIWSPWPGLRFAVGAVGFITLALSVLSGRVVANVKSQLAYASMAQVGVMYMELAFGFVRVAELHMFSHTVLRTWHFLRAGSLLQDFAENPAMVGFIQQRRQRGIERHLPLSWQRQLFLWSRNGFWLEAAFAGAVMPVLNAWARATAGLQRLGGWIYGQGIGRWPVLLGSTVGLLLLATTVHANAWTSSWNSLSPTFQGCITVMGILLCGGTLPILGWCMPERESSHLETAASIKRTQQWIWLSGLAQTVATLFCSRWLPPGDLTHVQSAAAVLLPASALWHASIAAWTRTWARRLLHVSNALLQSYTVLGLINDRTCQWTMLGGVLLHVTVMVFYLQMDRSDRVLGSAPRRAFRGFFAHDERMAEMALGLALVICGAPLTASYFVHDAAGHTLLAEAGLYAQLALMLAAAISGMAVYRSYIWLFHGARMDVVDPQVHAFTTREQVYAAMVVGMALVSGFILALLTQ